MTLGADISVGWKREGAGRSKCGRLMWARPGGGATTGLTVPWRESRDSVTPKVREPGKSYPAARSRGKGIFVDTFQF